MNGVREGNYNSSKFGEQSLGFKLPSRTHDDKNCKNFRSTMLGMLVAK